MGMYPSYCNNRFLIKLKKTKTKKNIGAHMKLQSSTEKRKQARALKHTAGKTAMNSIKVMKTKIGFRDIRDI